MLHYKLGVILGEELEVSTKTVGKKGALLYQVTTKPIQKTNVMGINIIYITCDIWDILHKLYTNGTGSRTVGTSRTGQRNFFSRVIQQDHAS